MDKSEKLARLLSDAESLIREDMAKCQNDFLKDLYTAMLKTLVDTKEAAQNNVLSKDISMFGFVYIISDYPTAIPEKIKNSIFKATEYYREVYSK